MKLNEVYSVNNIEALKSAKRDFYYDKAEECGIPEHMREGIVEYIMTGRPVGHFLTAIIENDLFCAAAHADVDNRWLLANYAQFFYAHAPVACYGEAHKRDLWIRHRGLEGPPKSSEVK